MTGDEWLDKVLGTTYAARSRSAGGSGTEWRAEWRFEPGVPLEATRLTVTVAGSDGRAAAHDLALPR